MALMNLCPPARWGSKAQGLAFLAPPRILGGPRKAQRAGFRSRKFAGEPKTFRPRPWAARGRSPLALKNWRSSAKGIVTGWPRLQARGAKRVEPGPRARVRHDDVFGFAEERSDAAVGQENRDFRGDFTSFADSPQLAGLPMEEAGRIGHAERYSLR